MGNERMQGNAGSVFAMIYGELKKLVPGIPGSYAREEEYDAYWVKFTGGNLCPREMPRDSVKGEVVAEADGNTLSLRIECHAELGLITNQTTGARSVPPSVNVCCEKKDMPISEANDDVIRQWVRDVVNKFIGKVREGGL